MTMQPKQHPQEIQALIAGALYDFAGRLTTGKNFLVGESHDTTPVLNALRDFANDRNLDVSGADVMNWQNPEALPGAYLPRGSSIGIAPPMTQLARLGALVFEKYTDPSTGWGDIDGGDLQDMAIRAGVFEPTSRVVPCSESCICAESVEPGVTTECMKFADGVAANATALVALGEMRAAAVSLARSRIAPAEPKGYRAFSDVEPGLST